MTTVEFLHSKGLKKWKNLQVTSDEHNKVIFLKELLEEYHEMKQKLLKHDVSGKRPTDEEIERWVKEHGYYGHCTQEYHEGLEEGARWGINKMSEAAGVPTRSDGKAGD